MSRASSPPSVPFYAGTGKGGPFLSSFLELLKLWVGYPVQPHFATRQPTNDGK